MNKIYFLVILLWFSSCKKEKCSLENGITNFDSTPGVNQLQGVYSSSDGQIKIKILPNAESGLLPNKGKITILRKLENDSCEQNGSFTVANLGESSNNFDTDYVLMCAIENGPPMATLRIAKYENNPAILLQNQFLNQEKCSEIIDGIAVDCSYLTLKKE